MQPWAMQKPVKADGKTIVPGPAKTSAGEQCVHGILGLAGTFFLKE